MPNTITKVTDFMVYVGLCFPAFFASIFVLKFLGTVNLKQLKIMYLGDTNNVTSFYSTNSFVIGKMLLTYFFLP